MQMTFFYIYISKQFEVLYFPVIYFPYKGFILSHQSIRGGYLLFPWENYWSKVTQFAIVVELFVIYTIIIIIMNDTTPNSSIIHNNNNVKSLYLNYCTNAKYFLPLLITNLIILNLAYFIISVWESREAQENIFWNMPHS